MIKILLVSPYSREKVGGIGTWTKLMLDYCIGRKDIELVFLNTVQGLPKRRAMKHRLFHLIVGSLDSILILFRILWYLCIHKPDVVHYTSSAENALLKDRIAAFLTRKLFGVTFIIHWRFGRIPTIYKEKGKEYCRFKRVLKIADMSLVLDRQSYEVLMKDGFKVELIPNPISQIIQTTANKLEIKNIQTHREQGVVLYVGHMLKDKGIFELVRACSEVTEVKKLIMIGPFFDVQLKEELLKDLKPEQKENWLELTGEMKREEVWEYYKKCSVFCLPSYSEGFPNVILEAMSFACPIVATKVGAIPEMLEDGCGTLVKSKQVEQLKIALSDLLNDSEKARVYGERAHAKVLSKYTIDKVFDMYYYVWSNCRQKKYD